jgi:oligo-1,6-glucosidase
MPADPPWWTRAVVYQVYPRSFQDSDGDGIGDLGGILQRSTTWPTWASTSSGSRRSTPRRRPTTATTSATTRDVDPLFGSLAQLDELIAALHARGMKLVMDLVVNHTSDQHPWFVRVPVVADSPKRDWYWWRPPRAGHGAGAARRRADQLALVFSGPTWELDEASGEYYLHLFDRSSPT